MYQLIQLLASVLAVAVVLTLHEFAHAYVAFKCGDPTPKLYGRISVNPLRHFDVTGFLCFALVGFGWAKPVPINPDNFRSFRKGLGLTACAGIVMNYLCAFVFYPLFLLAIRYASGNIFGELLYQFVYFLYAYSLSFCVFNLLPFYPLDGFRIVDACSRRHGKIYRFLRQYGYYILLFLIAESFICRIFVNFGVGIMQSFDLLGWVLRFATDIFGYPINALWDFIFAL